ncbi:MAG TPA: hypothetical protein VNT75_19405 [Symbiobacteriaceae bacterium]|nr:hypothetical protein [Symbiobacteriaceae bacterium]
MLSRLFGRRVTVSVRVLGQVGDRLVRWEGRVSLKAPASLAGVLRATARLAGVDLQAALAAGAQPALLLDGRRIDLPDGLTADVADGATISWLMPMAGG